MTAPVELVAGIGRSRRIPSVSMHIIGLSLIFVGFGMVVCAVVDVLKSGHATWDLMASAAISLATGATLWFTSRVPDDIRPKDVFMAVSLSWLATSVAGAMPFMFSGLLPRFDNALFESISGFTCTGSTVLSGEDFYSASPGVLFWRQFTQWFGGMGIIVLVVAALPFLGVGGLELISAEAPGPTSDRLAPRVKETAKRLWVLYVGFTIVSAVALLFTGIGWFDSAGLALAVVSTGGFAPEAMSIGHYDSVAVELLLVAGMIFGGMSFTLHYNALRGRPGLYLRNSEVRAYLAGIGIGTVLVSLILWGDGFAVTTAMRVAIFNVVTLATSCGFGIATVAGSAGDFTVWAPAAQAILFLFMWVGGMTGSTSGGLKVMRAQVMGRVAWRELMRARNPRAVLPIKQGTEPVTATVVDRIGAFILLYVLFIVAAALALTMMGSGITEAFSASVGSMGNMGPALGDAGPTSTFMVYSSAERMLLALLMLVGRLEVFPMTLAFVSVARAVRRGVGGSIRRSVPSPRT